MTRGTERAVRSIGAGVAAVALSMVLESAVEAAERPTRPNIVLIFSDDHAVQAIGAYGSRINETPNIDRLANEGAVFLNSFCTNSLCGPSRASILTGKHSHVNGFMRNGQRFDGGQPTFPGMLRGVGYTTAMIGKWHLGTDPTGFDHWEILPGQGNYYNPDFRQMDGSRLRREGYCTDIVTDLALEWLTEAAADADRPFMLMCQHKAPHRNWAPAERHLSMFDGRTIPVPDSLQDDYSGRTALLKENEMTIRDHFHWGHDAKFHGENLFPESFASVHGNGEYARMNAAQRAAWDAHYEPENRAFIARMNAGEFDDEAVLQWKTQRYLKDYLASVAAVDDSVGRILDHLDVAGLAENTIVIYASDQGFYLGEHGWYDKRWMFEESLKMPLLVRWPGVVPAGTRQEALVQNIDYAPTFLDVAGAEVPADIQGRSLVPVLDGGEAPADWRDSIYYAYYENAAVHEVPIHDGVRTRDRKLMFFPRTSEWQLFDLANDPTEMKSVHDDPEYAASLRAMQERYRHQRSFYGVNSAVIPTTRGDEKWWRERQAAKNARAAEGDVDLLFIGDSITQSWEGPGKAVWDEVYGERRAFNIGFSGDRTEHVLWRLRYGNLAGIAPKVAVCMIGTNNTGHRMQEPAEVAAGVRAMLDLLAERTPETKVVLLGIFPRGASPDDEKRINNDAINQRIRRFADGDRVRYLDIGAAFLEPDGTLSKEIMPDALHLSEEGYRRWAAAIEPALTDLIE